MLCAAATMLEETIPPNVADKGFKTSTNILTNLAAFICMILAAHLSNKKEELETTKFWII